MVMKKALHKLRRYLVIKQVADLRLPQFTASATVRRRYTFTGKVQKVGFRLEVAELAGKLGLYGWCRNLESGEVLAELQGEAAKIDFLVEFMHSLKRIRITRMAVEELPPDPQANEFVIAG